MAATAIPTYTKSGSKTATNIKLDQSVFGIMPKNNDLLKLAYTAYLANGRDNNAKAKTRGLVRGGGRKPFKQKGTGRARAGSNRSPIWRGGGVTFGPTGQENYTKKIQLSSKRLAIRQALSLAAKEDRIKIIETFECKDGKVKKTQQLLNKIGAQGSVLLVISKKDILVERATRNLPNLKAIHAHYINVFDVMNADIIVVSHEAIGLVSNWLGDKNNE